LTIVSNAALAVFTSPAYRRCCGVSSVEFCQQIHEASDAIQWRTDFVTHHRHEFGLGAVCALRIYARLLRFPVRTAQGFFGLSTFGHIARDHRCANNTPRPIPKRRGG